MFKNYFKIAYRNLLRHKGYTAINVVGLAVGMAACLLIGLYVRSERSYDHFHEYADRIYRVTWTTGFGGTAAVPASMLPKFKEDFDGVEAATHLFGKHLVARQDGEWVREEDFLYADSSIFDVFSFSLKAGDPDAALREPGTVVLTEATARRYFGDRDPLGQTLTLNDSSVLRVTGVIADVPPNSHLQFDAFVSLITLTGVEGLSKHDEALGFMGWQYLLLTGPEAAASVDARLDGIVGQGREAFNAYFGWWLEGSSFDLQALTRIHLYSKLSGEAGANGDARTLYLFSLIALFILLLACINYMNLATARAVQRTREVGVRKVVGARREQLVGQFLSESLLLSLGALLLAAVLAEAASPLLSLLAGRTFTISYDASTLGLFVGVALVTGLLSGSYPALVLSRFEPVRMLQGDVITRGALLRKVLVTFQFAVTAVLIIAALVVQRQLGYLQTKNLGYDTEQVLQLPLVGELSTQAEVFKTEVSQFASVANASLASGIPGRGGFVSTVEVDGEAHQVRYLVGDPDYLETMGMALREGRPFDPALATDSAGFLINEIGARQLGLTDKLGRPDAQPVWMGVSKPLGIVEDFHTTSLRDPIIPTVILMDPAWYRSLVLRLQKGRVAEALAELEAVWQRFETRRAVPLHVPGRSGGGAVRGGTAAARPLCCIHGARTVRGVPRPLRPRGLHDRAAHQGDRYPESAWSFRDVHCCAALERLRRTRPRRPRCSGAGGLPRHGALAGRLCLPHCSRARGLLPGWRPRAAGRDGDGELPRRPGGEGGPG